MSSSLEPHRSWPRARRIVPLGMAGVAALGLSGGIAGSAGAAVRAATTQHAKHAKHAGVVIDGAKVTVDAKLAAKDPAAVKKQGLVDITYNDAPPDELVTGTKLVGWEVDLGAAVAATLGIAWKPVASGAFDSFIPGLQNGRYNTSFTSFIYTPARVKQINIVTYYNVGTGFAVKKGSGIVINQPTDLCGKSVAVIEGSAFILQLNGIDPSCKKKGLGNVNVLSFPSDSAAELAVSSGRDQIYSSSQDQLSWLIQQTEHQFVLQPLNYDPVPEGAGVSKSSGITKLVAAAMDELIRTGTYAKIMKRWSLVNGLVKSASIYS